MVLTCYIVLHGFDLYLYQNNLCQAIAELLKWHVQPGKTDRPAHLQSDQSKLVLCDEPRMRNFFMKTAKTD